MSVNILIVEDEQSIADTLIYTLKQDGFNVQHVLLGQMAIELVNSTHSEPIDLIILDVGLPDMNGFDVCKTIRLTNDVPILFLTARDHEIDRVVGLEIGGDDYVTKPFSPREIAARVKVILKRVQKASSASVIASETTANLNTHSSLFQFEDAKKQFHYCQTPLNLTRYEYGLMTVFFAQPERVFSREQLLDAVWPDRCGSLDRVIDTHIKSLRAKLKQINVKYDPIKTHRGLGYSLDEKQEY